MVTLNAVEQKIVESAQHHQSKHPTRWKGQTDEYDAFYDEIHNHMMAETWPKIQSDHERMVAYWPAYFLWGSKLVQKRDLFEDRHYLHKMGTFGTGYACLTMSNLYTISLKQATEKFPLYEKGAIGFAFKVLSRMGGESDDRRPLREDRTSFLAVQSILDSQIVIDDDKRDVIALRTVNEQLLVYNHFSGHLEEIVTAIAMVRTGKLAQALGLQPKGQDQQLAALGREDPVEKLRQLKQMLDSGLINLQEYETKKVDILSRM